MALSKATKLVNDLKVFWNRENVDSDDFAYTIDLAEKHFTHMESLQVELDLHNIPDDSHHLQD